MSGFTEALGGGLKAVGKGMAKGWDWFYHSTLAEQRQRMQNQFETAKLVVQDRLSNPDSTVPDDAFMGSMKVIDRFMPMGAKGAWGPFFDAFKAARSAQQQREAAAQGPPPWQGGGPPQASPPQGGGAQIAAPPQQGDGLTYPGAGGATGQPMVRPSQPFMPQSGKLPPIPGTPQSPPSYGFGAHSPATVGGLYEPDTQMQAPWPAGYNPPDPGSASHWPVNYTPPDAGMESRVSSPPLPQGQSGAAPNAAAQSQPAAPGSEQALPVAPPQIAQNNPGTGPSYPVPQYQLPPVDFSHATAARRRMMLNDEAAQYQARQVQYQVQQRMQAIQQALPELRKQFPGLADWQIINAAMGHAVAPAPSLTMPGITTAPEGAVDLDGNPVAAGTPSHARIVQGRTVYLPTAQTRQLRYIDANGTQRFANVDVAGNEIGPDGQPTGRTAADFQGVVPALLGTETANSTQQLPGGGTVSSRTVRRTLPAAPGQAKPAAGASGAPAAGASRPRAAASPTTLPGFVKPFNPADSVDFRVAAIGRDAANWKMVNNAADRERVVKRMAELGIEPSNITGSMRERAANAGLVLQHLTDIDKILAEAERQGELGIVATRWNDFLTNKIGQDTTKSQTFAKLQSNLGFLQTAVAMAHGGLRGGSSPQMAEHWAKALEAKDPNTLRAKLGAAKSWMQGYASMTSGSLPGQLPKPPAAADPHAGKIPVSLKGQPDQTGWIPEAEFDPAKYDRIKPKQ